MEYRKFGNTGLEVSPICYGTMRYANKDGKMDEQSKEGARALEAAIERGINFIHSSYEYKTRWLTGQVLKKHPKRNDLHHIIKVNVPDWEVPTFSKKDFKKQIEDALRDLHTDRIAIVQHLQRGDFPRDLAYGVDVEPQRIQESDAAFELLEEAFDELKQEGKVGYLTTFPYTVGYAKKCLQSSIFSGLVAYYNCLETEMMDLFDSLKEKHMGFIGIRALAGGLLTNKRVDRNALLENDRMRNPEWDRLYRQFQDFREELGLEVDDWTRFAIRFSISDPMITSTVVSINTIDQLNTALNALQDPAVSPQIIEKAHELTTRYRDTFGIKGHASGIPIF